MQPSKQIKSISKSVDSTLHFLIKNSLLMSIVYILFFILSDHIVYKVSKTMNLSENNYEVLIHSAIAICMFIPILAMMRIEQKSAEEKIKYLTYYDSLTGLPNRVLFNERLKYSMLHSNRSGSMVSVLLLDLDRFKIINDTFGHIKGDSVLQEVSRRLQSLLNKDAVISRLGGDEFIILLPEVRYEKNITQMAQDILNIFKIPITIDEQEFFISTSIGISIYPFDGKESNILIKNAETAMYRAKEKGKSNYQFYTVSMNEKALERLAMESLLRKALEKNELFLVYQPQVSLKTGKIVGCEALIRWKHPKLGIVSPADFIPLAEETGLILPIGEWVIKNACMQNKIWQTKGNSNLRMSINISAQQFVRGNLVKIVENAIRESEVDPSTIHLEITESFLMDNSERNMSTVKKLKALGVDIEVDDFGKGFSSLSYLKEFDVDVLKIDRSFIMDIPADSNDMAIASAIISMAHDINLKVIAEGVETEEQLNFLRKKECDEIQGYYFSGPVGTYEFEKLMTGRKSLVQFEGII